MDPLTPKRKSPSDDFTAVKKLDLEDRTTLVTADVVDEPTSLSNPPAPPPVGMDLQRGTKLGDYLIEEKVGQGGMGAVYRAVHPLIGKYAAIKVLSHELKGEQYNIERFVDEARVVNTIGHPNIVDVFAFGETSDGRSYLVMEWLKGETLRARIDRAPLDLVDIADIVRPLTRALQAAHDKGVIHRDLKPDNVFLVEVRGEKPIVKLLDFGIAKPANTEHRVARTATGAIVGTPLYIAPEQAKGRAIDSAADVYALGGILFEMLCRRPPFLADNAMEIVAKHLMEPPPRPSQFVRVPPAIDDLVVSMLAKEPLQRPLLPAVVKVLDAIRDRAPTGFSDHEPSGRFTPTAGSDPNLVPMIPSISQPVISRMPTPTPLPEQRPLPLAAPRPVTPVPPDMALPVAAAPTTFVRAPVSRRTWIYVAAVVGVAVVIVIAIAASGGDQLDASSARQPAPAADEPKAEPAGSATPGDPAIAPDRSTNPPVAQDPPKQDPPAQDPPKQDPPKQDPPIKKDPVKAPVVKKDPPIKNPPIKRAPPTTVQKDPPVKKDPPPVKKDPPKKDPKTDPDGLFEPGAFDKTKKP